jgi:hypothetical protein
MIAVINVGVVLQCRRDRLAGFSTTQLSGERLLKARARRGAQAENQSEITVKAV